MGYTIVAQPIDAFSRHSAANVMTPTPQPPTVPEPVTPLPAATVIPLRPRKSQAGFEVLMMQRTADSSFAPSAYVFPGGRVDEADSTPDVLDLCVGVDIEMAANAMPDLGNPGLALGHWVCALREAFEEAGVFFAYDPDDSLHHISAVEEDLLGEVRRNVHNNRLKFADLLHQTRLRLATDRLHYYAHWITPEFSPKRFDTRFFAAEVPEGMDAMHDGVELVNSRWISPGDALDRHESGKLPMILPTIMTLKQLQTYDSIAAVFADKPDRPISNME